MFRARVLIQGIATYACKGEDFDRGIAGDRSSLLLTGSPGHTGIQTRYANHPVRELP